MRKLLGLVGLLGILGCGGGKVEPYMTRTPSQVSLQPLEEANVKYELHDTDGATGVVIHDTVTGGTFHTFIGEYDFHRVSNCSMPHFAKIKAGSSGTIDFTGDYTINYKGTTFNGQFDPLSILIE